MGEPLSIASGIAGLITLSSAVVAAGYKYLESVRNAPEDIQNLIRDIASLSALFAQLVSYAASPTGPPRSAFDAFTQGHVLHDCEAALQTALSLVQEYDASKSNHRSLKAMSWPLKQREINKTRDRINKLCIELKLALAIDSARNLELIDHRQQRHDMYLQQLLRTNTDTEEQKMLAWLSTLDPLSKHASVVAQRQPSTFEWLQKEDVVAHWIKSGDRIWLHSSSGAGKTVLVSGLVDHLREIVMTDHTSHALAFHYCDFANHPSLVAAEIIGSLVRQLIQQMEHFPIALRDLYHRQTSRDRPQLDNLTYLLRQILEEEAKTSYVVIDGLDECSDREELLNVLQGIWWQEPPTACSVRILLSSRYEVDVKQVFGDGPQFEILPKHTKQSLQHHVRTEIARIPRMSHLSDSARQSLENNLVSRADGMFRWVQCQLDVLQRARTMKALNEALEVLPHGLFETYDRLLINIDDDDVHYVERALKWLMGAERPLSLGELAEAVAINPAKNRLDTSERLIEHDDILRLCGSLVRVNEGRIVLAHFSVKEYLLSNRLTEQKYEVARFAQQQETSRHHVTTSLLSYVLTVGLQLQTVHNALDESQFPLISFARDASVERYRDFPAIRSWVERQLTTNEDYRIQLFVLIDYFKPHPPQIENYPDFWLIQQVLQCCLVCYWDGSLSGLHTSSQTSTNARCRDEIAKHLERFQRDWDFARELDLNVTHSDGRIAPTPLCTAAARGFEFVIRELLQRGCKVDGITVPYCVGNPLIRALKYGYEKAVQALADHGADFNLRSPGMRCSTALEVAATDRVEPGLIERLLQAEHFDLNLVDSKGRTIHYWAKYDTYIGRQLRPHANLLQSNRTYDPDYLDVRTLYTTIVGILETMKGRSTVRYHYGRTVLSQCLFLCGPEYHEYAAVFEEQGLSSNDPVIHPYHCNLCTSVWNGFLRGSRFSCLQCIDTDLCSDHHTVWKQSGGDMELCQGHTFYELPRPCWYGLKEGTVTEDGKTLPEVIELMTMKFSQLLDAAR